MRKQVNYCDDLTDEQFMRMCEEDDDMEDNSSLVDARKRRRRMGREESKERSV